VPLYIKDDEVDALAVRVKELTGASSKTEAVKTALLHEIERAQKQAPLSERLKDVWAIVDSMGPRDRSVDMKAFMDEGWGDA
jgi:antitoxin VapB